MREWMKAMWSYPWLPAVCFTVALLWTETGLAAQGTQRRLPEPITIAKKLDYADMVRLSPSQLRAVEEAYDVYREQFRTLHEQEFARVMEAAEGAAWTLTEDYFERLPGLIDRARVVDESFFDAWMPMLSEEQAKIMPRVRLRRDRDRLMHLQMMRHGTGMSVPDLGELLDAIDPPPAVIDKLDPLIHAYEQRLTQELQSLFRQVVEIQRHREDVEAAERYLDRLRRLRQFNRRAYTDLLSNLPDEHGRELEYEFLKRAYGAAFGMIRWNVEYRIPWIMQRETFDEQTQEALLALMDMARVERMNLLRSAMPIIDESGIAEFDSEERWGEDGFMTQIHLLRREAMQRDQKIARELDALLVGLSEDLAKRSRDAIRTYSTSMSSMMLPNRLVQTVTALHRTQPRPPRQEIERIERDPAYQFVPPPLLPQDVDRLTAALHADEDQRATINALFERYKQAYDSDIAHRRGRVQQLVNEAFGSRNEERGPVMKEWIESHRQMDRLLRDADATFFRQVRTMLEDDAEQSVLDRHERIRTYVRYNRGGFPGSISSHPNQAFTINLRELLRGFSWSDEEQAIIESVLDDHEQKIIELLRRRHELAMRRQIQSMASIEMRLELREDPDEDLNDYYIRLQRQLRELNQQIGQLNHLALDALAEKLPWEKMHPVLEAFREQAYARVISDNNALHRFLEGALELEDLSSEQRGTLAELTIEYRTEYRNIIDEMIDYARRYSPDLPAQMVMGDIERSREDREYAQAFGRLNDDRSRLNRRFHRRLQEALTDEQLDRIGPLPRPAE